MLQSSSRVLATFAICPILAGCIPAPPSTGPCDSQCEGTFHVAGVAEASNLLIRPDGTFHWNHNICDSTPRLSGRLIEVQGRTYLASDNVDDLFFPTAINNAMFLDLNEVPEVEIRVNEQGQLITVTGNESLVWAPGRVCTICASDDLTATGVSPCDCIDGPGGDPTEDVPKCNEQAAGQ